MLIKYPAKENDGHKYYWSLANQQSAINNQSFNHSMSLPTSVCTFECFIYLQYNNVIQFYVSF